MADIIRSIHWLHHSSFRIEAACRVIYVDPWKIKNIIPADLILVTHEHYDHFSINDIEKLVKDSTVVVLPEGMKEQGDTVKFRKIKPGAAAEISGITVQAVPAYNIGKQFHPKEDGKLGYIIEVEGKRIYHAGDTDATQEMKDLKDISVALLPVGGTYTMNAKEAAEAADVFLPEIAVPMHWGTIVGARKDAEEFKKLCKCKVEILEQEE